MNYETMVKEAYEEILGLDKEAAFEGAKKKYNRYMSSKADRASLKADEALERSALRKDRGNKKIQNKADLYDQRLRNAIALNNESLQNMALTNEHIKSKRGLRTDLRNAKTDYRQKANEYLTEEYNGLNDMLANINDRASDYKQKRRDLRHGEGFAAERADIAALKAKQRAHRADLADKAYAAKKLEKAATYYDEAQLAKEAAEANYAEACAYEEAALSILNELGYFED